MTGTPASRPASMSEALSPTKAHSAGWAWCQLPTESEFQHDYGVSRTTVRAALATLASEGLVLTRKGFGSYVRSRPPLRRVSSTHRHASHRDSGKPEFDTEAIAQGQVPSRRMLMIG